MKSGMVEVNHVSTVSAHYEVFENDVFSIRGRASTSCAAWVPKAGRAAPSCPILNINRGNNLYER
ncbi:MAG: hypothetical protein ACLRZH_00070 [Ruthenibacterium lactatiformans]